MYFTEAQLKALSAKLAAKHVRTREHGGRTLSYVEGWHAIAEANRIFGFDGWDRETILATCVWHGNRNGQAACTYVARVRIAVRAGGAMITRDGSGSGHGKAATLGEAHELALKGAETDATKRALPTFGNQFGLALYDRERRGVRGRQSATNTGVGRGPINWTVLSSAGKPVSTHNDPGDYCSALRKELESARSSDEIGHLWNRNQPVVAMLHENFPDLTNETGIHFADILANLYKRKLETFEAGQKGPQLEKAIDVKRSIDKSVLALAEPRRIRDKEHLRNVARQPCLVCGRRPSQAHHLRFAQLRALGRKVSDEWAVALCNTHHSALHSTGDEEAWWKRQRINPVSIAEKMWSESQATKIATNL